MYNSEQVDPVSQKKTWSWNDKINTFLVNKDTLNWTKTDNKANVKYIFHTIDILLNFLFIKEMKNKLWFSQKYWL